MANQNDLVIRIGADTNDASRNIRNLEGQLRSLGQGITRTGNVPRLNNTFSSLGSSMKKLTLNTNSLAAAFGKFYASYFMVIRGTKKLWASIKQSAGFLETVSYYNKAYDQLGQKAVETMGDAGVKSAETFTEMYKKTSEDLLGKMTGYGINDEGHAFALGSASLGINPNDMLNYQAQFAQLTSSMGVASDYAEKLSRALIMLGGDLSSLKNMDFTETWGNLSSGLVGQARTVDKFGANIRNAAMQQKLLDLGIDESITKLGQEDKALLRTIIILEATRTGWGDLAGTLDRPMNQLRVLKASFESLSRAIGNVFLTALQSVIPYINALVIALRTLIESAMSFFGIELPKVTGGAGDAFSDLNDEIEATSGALDDASGSAKKLKQNLLGIDELNVISSPSDSGGAGGGGSNLSGATAALQKAFDELFGNYEAVWDSAFKNVENKAQKMADDILAAIKKGDWKAIGSTIGGFIKDQLDKIDWNKIYENAGKFGTNLANFFNGLISPELFATLGKTWAGWLNTEFYALAGFVKTFDWKNAGLSLASFVKGFIAEIDEVNIAKTISGLFNGAFKMIGTFLTETPWKEVGIKIGNFLKNLDWPGILAGMASIILGAIAAGFRTLAGVIWADPISGAIVTGIVACMTVDKVMLIGNALMKAINSSTALSFLAKGTYTNAATGIAKGLSTGLGGAWTHLGGLGGILTKDVGEIMKSGASDMMGLTIGTGIIGGISAAIMGYKLGDAIYHNLIEDTEWDAFGYDYFERLKMEERARDVAEEIRKGTESWDSVIEEVASDLNWEPLFKFEGSEEWATIVNEMNIALTELGNRGYDLNNTTEAMEGLESIEAVLSETTYKYMERLVSQYGALDDTTKAILEQKYGLDDLIDDTKDINLLAEHYKTKQEEAASATDTNKLAVDDVATSLMNEKNKIAETIEQLRIYQAENGGSYETSKQLYDALEDQKRILGDNIEYWKNYQKEHGGSYITAKQLYDAEKELDEATGKSGESAEEATGAYNELMGAFENSTLSGADFAAYMDTLAEEDVPAAIEQIGGMDDAVKTLSGSLPDLKTNVEDAFGVIKDDLENISTNLLPDFETAFSTAETNLETTVLPNMKTAFETTVGEIITELDKIPEWYDTNLVEKFSESNVVSDLGGLEAGITTVFENVCKAIQKTVNRLISAINEAFDISWDALSIDGEEVFGSGNAKLINITPIQGFANGGYPKMGNLFYANEAGPELVGTMNGKTAVAPNQEITGIKDAIYDVAAEIISEMRNNDTTVVLEGDAKGMFKQVRNQARIYQKSTGSPAFNF